jgi:uncharacterized protein (TIGR04255 family)
MVEAIHFPNAPITEALLDIRVKLPPETSLTRLATFQDAVKQRYPSRQERLAWEGHIEIKSSPVARVSQSAAGGPIGYLFTSVDGKHVVQARMDGFTFSRLKPYDKWEGLRDEAKDLWRHYIKIASPESVIRVALRYINRIEIPLPIRDFKDYILTTPEIAPDLPQGLDSFFMRLVIPDGKTQAVAIVTETVEAIDESSNRLPLIFDIDVFRLAAFNIQDKTLWETFEQLHDLKNDIFFKSITPKAKELFL